jgi:hypothetical protein
MLPPVHAYRVRDGEWKEDSVRGEDSRRTRLADRSERKARQQEHAREPLSGSGGLG